MLAGVCDSVSIVYILNVFKNKTFAENPLEHLNEEKKPGEGGHVYF